MKKIENKKSTLE